MTMLFSNLLISLSMLLSCPWSVESIKEGGVRKCGGASDGGTCINRTGHHLESFCFPDGECFGSLEEAEISYNDPNKSTHMQMAVPTSLGERQSVKSVSGHYYKETLEVLARAHDYMLDLFQNNTARSFRNECKLHHELCAYWAAIGECEANPTYMLKECAPVCQSCHELSFEHRCPYDKNDPKAWGPGDLNKMFERLTNDEYYVEKFQPTILSQPPDGPWVVTLENVATEDQCNSIIELGSNRGYERSIEVGAMRFDGTFEPLVHDARTSRNTWCVDKCFDDKNTQEVIRSVENVTGIADENSEFWQLLQYEETQHYGDHHDFIPFHLERSFGPRILTVFLYLNDVKEGGGTHFTNLGITVQPKTGRAVVWPNVLDSHPDRKDSRTNHQALPVTKGVKYGGKQSLLPHAELLR